MEKVILIVGGGISGLALAQGLSKNGIKFKLFERDESKNLRSQGYRIRISPEGALPLREMLNDNLWNLFKESSAQTTFGMTSINAKDAKIIKRNSTFSPNQKAVDESLVFTADRTTLRNLLTLGIEDSIEFNKKFISYDLVNDPKTNETRVRANFADGSSFIGDLLIGADGVNSLVKKQLIPQCKTFDTNGRCIFGKTPLSDHILNTLPASCCEWITTINDKAKGIILFMETIKFKPVKAQPPQGTSFTPESVDYIYWVLLGQSHVFEKSDEELFKLSPSELKQHQLHLIHDWDPRLKEIISCSDESKSNYLGVTSSFPDIMQFETNQHVTLMGDSIHNMSPTGGAGANTALYDCSILLKAILNGSTLQDLQQYELKMRENAKVNIEGSLMGAKSLYNFTSIEQCKVINQ